MASFLGRLLLPPLSLLILATLGALFSIRRPRLGIALVASSLVLLLVLSTPAVAISLQRSLQWSEPRAPTADADGAQAIVVLGAGLEGHAPEFGGAVASSLSLERVRYGAFLAKRLRLPVLVTGGKLDPDAPPLGPLLAEALRLEFGVENVRWIDATARTTWENAERAAEMLKPAGVTRVLLVTHAWHLPRARYAFETAGLEVVPAPTGSRAPPEAELGDYLPSARALWQSSLALHEWLGLGWYRVRHR